jgi:hypothetical protein
MWLHSQDFAKGSLTMKVLGACGLLAMLTGPALADPAAMDTPVTMGGIETVCTGIGSGKDDPRWAAYPVRVEFSNAAAQYLSGAHVSVAAKHKTLADFDCQGPWVLLKLPAGSYTVTATIDGSNAKPRSATFKPPAHGQKRIELQFPDFKPNQ